MWLVIPAVCGKPTPLVGEPVSAAACRPLRNFTAMTVSVSVLQALLTAVVTRLSWESAPLLAAPLTLPTNRQCYQIVIAVLAVGGLLPARSPGPPTQGKSRVVTADVSSHFGPWRGPGTELGEGLVLHPTDVCDPICQLQ